MPRQRLRHQVLWRFVPVLILCRGEDGNGPQVGANMGSCSMVLMRGGFQAGTARRACHGIFIVAFK